MKVQHCVKPLFATQTVPVTALNYQWERGINRFKQVLMEAFIKLQES